MGFLSCCTSLNSKRGQSIVELTLITPLLLAALMVAVDFGIAFHVGNVVSTAARDGARIGSELEKTGGTATEPDYAIAQAQKIRDYVQARLPDYLTSRQIAVTFYEDDPGVGPPPCAESVQVRISGNYPFTLYRIMRFFGFTVNASTLLARETRMRYNYQRYDQHVLCTSSPNVNSGNATFSVADG